MLDAFIAGTSAAIMLGSLAGLMVVIDRTGKRFRVGMFFVLTAVVAVFFSARFCLLNIF
jgi:hypothetical protein